MRFIVICLFALSSLSAIAQNPLKTALVGNNQSVYYSASKINFANYKGEKIMLNDILDNRSLNWNKKINDTVKIELIRDFWKYPFKYLITEKLKRDLNDKKVELTSNKSLSDYVITATIESSYPKYSKMPERYFVYTRVNFNVLKNGVIKLEKGYEDFYNFSAESDEWHTDLNNNMLEGTNYAMWIGMRRVFDKFYSDFDNVLADLPVATSDVPLAVNAVTSNIANDEAIMKNQTPYSENPKKEDKPKSIKNASEKAAKQSINESIETAEAKKPFESVAPKNAPSMAEKIVEKPKSNQDLIAEYQKANKALQEQARARSLDSILKLKQKEAEIAKAKKEKQTVENKNKEYAQKLKIDSLKAVELANLEATVKQQKRQDSIKKADINKQLELAKAKKEEAKKRLLEDEQAKLEKEAKLEKQRAEAKKIEDQKAEAKKLELAKIEQEKLAKKEAKRKSEELKKEEADKMEAKRKEFARIEAEKKEASRLAQAKIDEEKAEAKKMAQAKLNEVKTEGNIATPTSTEGANTESTQIAQTKKESKKSKQIASESIAAANKEVAMSSKRIKAIKDSLTNEALKLAKATKKSAKNAQNGTETASTTKPMESAPKIMRPSVSAYKSIEEYRTDSSLYEKQLAEKRTAILALMNQAKSADQNNIDLLTGNRTAFDPMYDSGDPTSPKSKVPDMRTAEEKAKDRIFTPLSEQSEKLLGQVLMITPADEMKIESMYNTTDIAERNRLIDSFFIAKQMNRSKFTENIENQIKNANPKKEVKETPKTKEAPKKDSKETKLDPNMLKDIKLPTPMVGGKVEIVPLKKEVPATDQNKATTPKTDKKEVPTSTTPLKK